MTLNKKKGCSHFPRYKNINIGKKKEAVILESETNLDKVRTNKNIPKEAKPTCHDRAINIPKPVATAFPPLPFSQIGQICPATAKEPANTS